MSSLIFNGSFLRSSNSFISFVLYELLADDFIARDSARSCFDIDFEDAVEEQDDDDCSIGARDGPGILKLAALVYKFGSNELGLECSRPLLFPTFAAAAAS